jgi:glycerophosphoryl diester phosphodiesterase
MVKFGRHINAFISNDNAGTGLYVVPYNDIKRWIHQQQQQQPKQVEDRDANQFEREWRDALRTAVDDFAKAVGDLWEQIFGRIASLDEARGALPDVAIRLYVQQAGVDASQELLTRLKQIHAAAYNNAEALRKLVKKFDKYSKHKNKTKQLSPRLIPAIYAANFTMGLPMLEQGETLFRSLLGIGLEHIYDDAASIQSHRDASLAELNMHQKYIEGRQAELDWLSRLTVSLEPDELSRLVAHRGYHSVKDRSNKRPIENSLTAYEAAWTNGIHLCECDIALTKDEKIILAHDEDFSRLALDRNSPMSNKQVGDLTFKELIALPLLSGSRPPLLIDVLQSARHIGGGAQLVIEIKPGNEEAATALARMLIRHPELMPCIALIMSFDCFTMHNLRRELLNPPHISGKNRLNTFSSIPTSMSLMKFGSDNLGGDLGGRVSSIDHFGIGLTLSEAHLDHHLESEHQYPTASSISQHGRNNSRTIPRLMLLTVAHKPQHPCELWVQVDDLSPIDGWLKSGPTDGSLPYDEGSLDGIYMQFQKEMLEPEGAAALLELSRQYFVGIWAMSGIDPDDFQTFQSLIQSGVSFVNTDLPNTFRPEISVRNRTS